jgi:hypothetical protein
MSEQIPEDGVGKLHFEPSTIETIDRSVLNYVEDLNLFTTTNKGWKKVPVLWGTSERSFLSKDKAEIRDSLGALIYPIISVKRTSFKKDLKSPGIFQGTVPEASDHQGGSLDTQRVIYQEKTTRFANADAAKLHGQTNYPGPNPKIVYRTISVPMPVNVEISYEITIRTEYQQQMNDLMLPFITKPGTVNFVRLTEAQHRYEGFIQSSYQSQDNLSDYSSDERKFETKLALKVIGYLVGEGDNRVKPHYAIRENAVEVKIPRERISLQEVPEHEYGRYYGLAGIPAFEIQKKLPFSSFFSNLPTTAAANAGTAGTGASVGVSGNIVTTTNFVEVLTNNLVIRELLKESEGDIPSPANQLTVTGATIKTNTESLYLNGMILAYGAEGDYTLSNNVITFNFNLTTGDSVYITYIIDS